MKRVIFLIFLFHFSGCSSCNHKFDQYRYKSTLKNISCYKKVAYDVMYIDSINKKSNISIPINSLDCEISSYSSNDILSTGYINEDVFLIEVDRFYKNSSREVPSERKRLEIHRLLFSKSKKELTHYLLGNENLVFVEKLFPGCYYQVTSSVSRYHY